MIAILEIYVCAIALMAVVGRAARALLCGDDALWRADILPLGLAVVVGVLSVAVYVVTVPVTTAGLLLASLAILGWRAWTRRRDTTPSRDASPARNLTESWALGIGVAVGLVALIPLFWVGLPTTVAISIGDGWAYAAEISWLRDHTLSAHIPTGTKYPLNGSLPDQIRGGLTVGFKLFATAVGAVTRRAPFELVNATSAAAFAVSVVSWREFWCAIRRDRRGSASPWMATVAASPLLVYLYAENQTPNLFALALLPYAIARAVHFARTPGLRADGGPAIPASAVGIRDRRSGPFHWGHGSHRDVDWQCGARQLWARHGIRRSAVDQLGRCRRGCWGVGVRRRDAGRRSTPGLRRGARCGGDRPWNGDAGAHLALRRRRICAVEGADHLRCPAAW